MNPLMVRNHPFRVAPEKWFAGYCMSCGQPRDRRVHTGETQTEWIDRILRAQLGDQEGA